MALLAPHSNQRSSLASAHTCQVGKAYLNRGSGLKIVLSQTYTAYSATPPANNPDIHTFSQNLVTLETKGKHPQMKLRRGTVDCVSGWHAWTLKAYTWGSLSYWKPNPPPLTEPQFSCTLSHIHLQDLVILFFTILSHPEWP